MKPDFFNDLNLTLEYIRQQCLRATVDRKHDLRQIFVASHGDIFPELRTVILRAFDWPSKKLIFHTDSRSQKYRELENNPKISVLGYSHKKKFQIRIRGTAVLNLKNDAAKFAWQGLGASARRSYLFQSPGSPLEVPSGGFELSVERKVPDLCETESGFENFAVVVIQISQIEWLYLSELGHRRARFQFSMTEGQLTSQHWLCP